MATPWWNDDDRLLAALKDAGQSAQDVPPEFVEAGKALFTWRDIDAELAALTYDSAFDDSLESATRGSEQAPLRALIFATDDVTIELEVGPEALLGQLLPADAGTAETHMATGDAVTAPIDESGCFVFRPAPSGAFRLRCQSAPGTDVVTGWIAL